MDKSLLKQSSVLLSLTIAALVCLAANIPQAWAKDRGEHEGGGGAKIPMNRLFQNECSACHIAYPANLLPANDWQNIMNNLSDHYGADASLSSADAAEINAYLQQYAGISARLKQVATATGPLPRLTETQWFVRKHSEDIPAKLWRDPAVKSASNCAACHTTADKGDFNEDNVRLPKATR